MVLCYSLHPQGVLRWLLLRSRLREMSFEQAWHVGSFFGGGSGGGGGDGDGVDS